MKINFPEICINELNILSIKIMLFFISGKNTRYYCQTESMFYNLLQKVRQLLENFNEERVILVSFRSGKSLKRIKK